LQQLVMESNGKSVNTDGQAIDYHTCPILWGSIGTVGQHSFHQLLHQGTRGTAVDFILPLESHCGDQANQDGMIANCLAQAEVLMTGARRDDIEAQLIEQGAAQDEAHWLAKHKAMRGNQPSTIISFQKLDAFSLGALVALYEHRVFCTSVLWGINPFDQWGVELGKQIAGQLERQLSEGNSQHNNPATCASLQAFLAATGRSSASKEHT
jgi:glucose-6-phosphate isomerase